MNPCIFALTIIAYTVWITKSDSAKNKYVPYNNAYNGGGPHSYYNKFPKFQYISISDNNVLHYEEYPLDVQWVFYLCREMNFCTCDAQSFIKEHPEVIEVSPPCVTRLTSQEKHYTRADIS